MTTAVIKAPKLEAPSMAPASEQQMSIPRKLWTRAEHRRLPVFREPTETGYASEMILTPEDEIYSLAAPESAIRVADLLP